MNGFFGGTYGQLAMSVPSLGGSRWQLAGRAFAIASSYNDRAFVNGREHYEWNISQRPAHASVWLLRPLSARLSVRAGYELDYTGFDRASSTASSFAVPVSQVAHGIRVAMDGQWAGLDQLGVVVGRPPRGLASPGATSRNTTGWWASGITIRGIATISGSARCWRGRSWPRRGWSAESRDRG